MIPGGEPVPTRKNGGWLDSYQSGGWDNPNRLATVNDPVKGISAGTQTFQGQHKNASPAERVLTPEEQSYQEIMSESMRSADPRRSAWDKAGAIARNPMTAAQYVVQGKSIPDYFEKGDRNIYENAMDVINPMNYYDAAKNTLSGKHFRGAQTVGQMAMAVPLTLLDAAEFLPGGAEENAIAKAIKKEKSGLKQINNKFKSEIDWGKWNKEIPDNKPLMDEYHAIEQTSKGNNTWMKNLDGSAFQGTPEQFVQQNSQNFKNAFGKTKFVDKYEKPIILHHGHFTDKDFSSFVPSGISGISNSGYEGNYSFFTPHKSIAADYAGIGQGLHNAEDAGYKSYIKSVYVNSENPLIDARTEFADINIPKSLREGKDAIAASLDPTKFGEVAVPYGNNVKSAIGNNGMFNMKNRNIYKTLLPLGIGAAAMSQQDTKQYGGKTKGWLNKYK